MCKYKRVLGVTTISEIEVIFLPYYFFERRVSTQALQRAKAEYLKMSKITKGPN